MVLVRSAFNPLLEIDEPWIHKHGMRVRIDESGDHYFSRTIDFNNLLAILCKPGIATGVFGCSDSDNLAACAENCPVLDDA